MSSVGAHFKPREMRLVNFQQVIEIYVGKTLAAEEMTSHDHDGKGEKEACVQRM